MVLLVFADCLPSVSLEVLPAPVTSVSGPLVGLPLGGMIVRDVAGDGDELEVFWPVVVSDSVDMVGLFSWPEGPAKFLLQDDPVFKFVFAAPNPDGNVSVASLESTSHIGSS